MKKIACYLFGAVLMISAISGCKKDVYGCIDPSAYNYNPNANVGNGSCLYYGNVTFWFASNMANATVTIDGQTATITGYYQNGAPSCNATGCANFTLPAGTYTYTAVSSQYTWGTQSTLTATVVPNGCNTYQLQ
jgi:hypothetical protein